MHLKLAAELVREVLPCPPSSLLLPFFSRVPTQRLLPQTHRTSLASSSSVSSVLECPLFCSSRVPSFAPSCLVPPLAPSSRFAPPPPSSPAVALKWPVLSCFSFWLSGSVHVCVLCIPGIVVHVRWFVEVPLHVAWQGSGDMRCHAGAGDGASSGADGHRRGSSAHVRLSRCSLQA